MPVVVSLQTNRNIADDKLCESVTATHTPTWGQGDVKSKDQYGSKFWVFSNFNGSVIYAIQTTDVDTNQVTIPISLLPVITDITVNLLLQQSNQFGGISGYASQVLPCIVPQSF